MNGSVVKYLDAELLVEISRLVNRFVFVIIVLLFVEKKSYWSPNIVIIEVTYYARSMHLKLFIP